MTLRGGRKIFAMSYEIGAGSDFKNGRMEHDRILMKGVTSSRSGSVIEGIAPNLATRLTQVLSDRLELSFRFPHGTYMREDCNYVVNEAMMGH